MSQLAFALPGRPSYGQEDFLLSASNEQAHAMLLSWPRWPHSVMALYGPPASGKTHLAHVWAARSGARFLAPSQMQERAALELMDESPAWVVEEAGALPSRPLLHLINAAVERRGSLLLTSRLPLAAGVTLPDLSSRLSALPVAMLPPPDDALLEAMLVKQFADRQLRVGREVIAYLLPRIERSPRAVAALVEALDARALGEKRNITLPWLREILPGFMESPKESY